MPEEDRKVESLADVLENFDQRTDSFSENNVLTALGALRGDIDSEVDLEPSLKAELLAFRLVEHPSSDASGWGTFFGPNMRGEDKDGQPVDSPALESITPEVVEYWERRLNKVRHPLLRVRYAGLVWDFSRKVKYGEANVSAAKVFIDSVIDIADNLRESRAIRTVPRLKHALKVALQLNDRARISAVRDAMLLFEERTGEDKRLGLWGHCFDELLQEKKVNLTDDQKRKIIDALEARLERCCDEKNLYPEGVEAAAMRLARHHRRFDDQDALRRVLRRYAHAHVIAAQAGSPLVGLTWLEKVYSVLHEFGMHEDADSLEPLLKKLGRKAVDEFTPLSTKIEISKEEWEAFLESITEGNLTEALERIAANFIPNRSEIETQVRDLMEKAPLQALIPQALTDFEGRVVARVGSVEGDLDGRIAVQMSQNLGFEIIFLRRVLERAVAKFSITAGNICEHLYASPAFPPENRQLVEIGVDAYLAEQWVEAISVLTPQIETVVRRVQSLIGGAAYRLGRGENLVLKTLDEILRDAGLEETLGQDVVLYLRVLLTDQRGWNVRNRVCHGMMEPAAFGPGIADRLIHALLALSMVRYKGTT